MFRCEGIGYLQHGTERQRAAYRTLTDLSLFEVLRPFSPFLCGTIPLAIDLPESDLDIICEVRDLDAFERHVRDAFSHLAGYSSHFTEKNGLPTCVCRFSAGGFPIELFGQPRPVVEQNAYRHMVVESRLLALAGTAAADAIRALKASGLKTEPAFCAYFGLDGDPYERLLALFDADDSQLQPMIAHR